MYLGGEIHQSTTTHEQALGCTGDDGSESRGEDDRWIQVWENFNMAIEMRYRSISA